jgi:adenylosuccinate lyase
MQVSQILSEIDREIERLQQARRLLAGAIGGGRGATLKTAKKGTGRRKMSADARRRISEAQKARWAERRKRVAAKSSR